MKVLLKTKNSQNNKFTGMKTILVTAFALTVAITSCKKNSDAPVVSITSPVNNSSIVLGDSIHIEGKLTDDKSLHEAAIYVMSPGEDTVLKDYPYVHEKKTHSYHYHYKPDSLGVYLLQVIAEDHDGNTTIVARNFSVTP